MSAELHVKLLAFLAEQIALTQGRQCTKIDLMYSPPGFRDTELRSWTRQDKPEIFEVTVALESFVGEIIEIAENHADCAGKGTHRYMLRTQQHHGGRPVYPFKLQAAAASFDSDDTALVLPSQSAGQPTRPDVDVLAIMAQNNAGFMRIHAQMFDGVIRSSTSMIKDVTDENTRLRNENGKLKDELERALSSRDLKEYEFGLNVKKAERDSATTQKLLQFGSVIISHVTGANTPELGAPDPFTLLLTDFAGSFRSDQVTAMMNIFDIAQKGMFFRIMQMAAERAEAANKGKQPPNGAPNGRPPGMPAP